jgi:hypothetical protein
MKPQAIVSKNLSLVPSITVRKSKFIDYSMSKKIINKPLEIWMIKVSNYRPDALCLYVSYDANLFFRCQYIKYPHQLTS